MVDAHIHLKPSDEAAITSLLHQMDNNGVKKAMLILNLKEEYDAFMKEFQTFTANKDRFWVAIGLNIHDADSFNRFKVLSDKGVFPKIKIHPHLFQIRKDEIDIVVKAVEAYNTQIIVDSLYYGCEIEFHNGVEVGVALARYYPERKIVMAHSGSLDFLKCMMATRYLPNVFYDYSFIQTFFQHTSMRMDMVNFLSRTANRIMFGSDFPSFAIDNAFKNMNSLIEEAGLTEDQRFMVLSQNAEKVYE